MTDTTGPSRDGINRAIQLLERISELEYTGNKFEDAESLDDAVEWAHDALIALEKPLKDEA